MLNDLIKKVQEELRKKFKCPDFLNCQEQGRCKLNETDLENFLAQTIRESIAQAFLETEVDLPSIKHPYTESGATDIVFNTGFRIALQEKKRKEEEYLKEL